LVGEARSREELVFRISDVVESVAGHERGYTLKLSPGKFIALIGRFRLA
jgi:hypothetical protein